ncbi:MAG: hypothetical protein Q7R61_02060 [bacterium]|nr:hypothetical protein [bacterium]
MPKKLFVLILYAIAMALIESAVVIYLRELYYPAGFLIKSASDLAVIPYNIIRLELWREVATIIMLVAIGFLFANRLKLKIAGFVLAFSIWDLFYYFFLYVFLKWPSSLFTLDVYFLIPFPWVGPVWFPLMLFSALTIISLWFIIKSKNES